MSQQYWQKLAQSRSNFFTHFSPYFSGGGSHPSLNQSDCQYEKHHHANSRRQFFKLFEGVHLIRRVSFFREKGKDRQDISNFIFHNVYEYEFVRLSVEMPQSKRIETLFGYVKTPREHESELKPQMLLGVLCNTPNNNWCFVPFTILHEDIVEIEVYTFKIPIVFHDHNDQDKVKDMLSTNAIPPAGLDWFKFNIEPVSQLKFYRKTAPIAIVASIIACQRNMHRIEILLTREIPVFIVQPPKTRFKDIIDELYSRQEVPENLITEFAQFVPNLRNLHYLLADQISKHFRFD